MNESDTDVDLSPWGGSDLNDHFIVKGRDD